ncbi:hybrid sensor histidine kinase/response regulator [Ideonella sp. BN130291]|uniref:hybrid sensor histidine kinase/response regulator n=1 Tax=Ideonella sp. BN130291 TaxID=3112940 RepID=UPI002E26E289|nr:ATP-binding protein [Ideonella sp. BN130291]
MTRRTARLSPRTWSFRVQIPALMIGASLATAVAISLAVGLSARQWLQEGLRDHASTEAQSLARSIAAHLVRDDVWEAFGAVSAVARDEGGKHRADVVVLGRNGQVFVSSDPRRFRVQSPVAALNEPLRQASALAGPPGRPVVRDVSIDSRSYSVIRLALVSSDHEPIGTLLMSYPHSLLATHYAQTLATVATISIGFVAALLPLSWWLGRRMAEPVARATEALYQLAEDAAAKSSSLADATSAGSPRVAAAPAQAGELARLEHSVIELRRHLEEKDVLHAKFAALNESLRERDARIRRLVDANIIGIRIADADGRITEANAAYLDMLGYSHEDVAAGRLNTNELTPPEYGAAEAQALKELETIGRYRPFEKEYVRRDGSRVPVLAGGALLDPAVQSTVGFALDLTERRQAEAEREARRAAELANRAKSQFLATMSHELRTPLNGILGYAQLLGMDSALSERQCRGINTIRESGEHLLSLINDILDLSRIEAGRIELCPTPVDLVALLRSVVEIVRVKADQKDLIVAFDVAADLPAMVLVDLRRLRQVLLNLLGNAVKFTDSGTVSLVARSEGGTEDGFSLLHIDVSDTGVGIKPEDVPAIFKPFEQVGDVRRREAGTGLGLTITRALVRAMGGDIRVTSELGRGSRFSVTLRLQHADPIAPRAAERNGAARYEGRRRRVLIVDDVAQNRSLLSDFLAIAGFESLSAEDGQQGIEKARTFRPDLVVMDSVMPVMSGLEATRRLRQDPAFNGLPIIAVSANVSEDHRRKCLAAGADLYLSKPVRLPELASAIGQLLHLDLQWQ